MKTYKLNYKLNEINHNGRLYPKDVTMEAITKAVDSGILMYNNVDKKRVVGRIISVSESDCSVYINVDCNCDDECDCDCERECASTASYGQLEHGKVTELTVNYMYLVEDAK